MKKKAIKSTRRSGFTLVELIAVIIVLAILAGVAVPKYFDYTAKARESATKASLGNARSAIANFYTNEALQNGTAAYPTLVELETLGTVLAQSFPPNPFNNSSDVQAATWSVTAPPVTGTAGWNYDVSVGRLWANSDTTGVDENEW